MRGLRLSLRSKRHRREGAAAVEFALIALPFFVLLFAVLELGITFVLDSLLESATIETGRLVRTGQAQAKGFDAAKFKTELCSRMSVFEGDCKTRATVDVREIPQFSAPVVPDPAAGDKFDPTVTGYSGGSAGSLMLVRVWYQQPMVTPVLTQMKSPAGAGKILLTATTAFKNEPWQ